MSTPTNISLLRLPAVRLRTGLSRSGIYNAVNDGTFPRPIKVGARAIAWPSNEVDRWIDQRIRESQT